MPRDKKAKKTPIIPFPLRMKPEVREQLQRLADADRRTLNVYINLVLERYVAGLEGNDDQRFGVRPL